MSNHIAPVALHTLAYNSETYIRECAESIINQTFADFEWRVVDNGSTDRTGEILEEYARKDSRIKLFRNERNSILFNEPMNPDYIRYGENNTAEYWCVVDSDDYLHKDFLKDLYSAASERNADIAVAGTEMFKEEMVTLRSKRCPPDFYSNDITYLGDIFPEIYGCFRPMWGKLVRYSLIRKHLDYRRKHPVELKNGGDTLLCLDILSYSKSVVGLNRVLHYYRVRSESLYQSQVDKRRYFDSIILYEEAQKLLQSWDKLNVRNEKFIASVFYFSIIDCIKSAVNTTSAPVDNRLEAIESILSDVTINRVFQQYGAFRELFVELRQLMDGFLENILDDDVLLATMHYVYRLFAAIRMANAADGNKQNAFLLYLSALCDEKNKHHFGLFLLNDFLAVVGKDHLSQLDQLDVTPEAFANPILLREMMNWHADSEKISTAKQQIEINISNGNLDEAIDLLVMVLDNCPLDKTAIFYKMYLLAMNGDVTTLVETAVALIKIFPDDYEALAFGAQSLASAGIREAASNVYQMALLMCTDETRKSEIASELAAINN